MHPGIRWLLRGVALALLAGIPAWSAALSQAPIGGSGFSLRSGATGVLLSWATGTSQTGYLLLRWSPQSGFAFLPSPTNLLAGGATTYTDTTLLVDPTYCYVLLPLGGNPASVDNVLGLSDLLCVYPGTGTGATPQGLSVRLDQSTLVSLSWTAPGAQDGYDLVAIRFDNTPNRTIPLPGSRVDFQEDLGGLTTCYQLRAKSAGQVLAGSNIVCAAPGISSLPPNPPATFTPIPSPTFTPAATATSSPTAPLGPPSPSPTRTPSPTISLATATPGLPPDPASIAPPLDRSVVTEFASAVAFLYSPPAPVQVGVAPNTIDPRRAAVLRGQVITTGGQPRSGARVTILNHPEYGQTQSRSDGFYDLVVNGGGPLTVQVQLTGYLPVQRQLDTRWREYHIVPTVALAPPDSAVGTITAGTAPVAPAAANPCQVMQSSPVADAAGSRQATLVFQAGTQATMRLPNGTTQNLSTLHVRSTELSVGVAGEAALPGTLPKTVAYAHAATLSVDEAQAAGAVSVQFTPPAARYTPNFLHLPVGSALPTGRYDPTRGLWQSSASARVMKVLSVSNGLANFDIDGSGQPASDAQLAAHGITTCERMQFSATAPGVEILREPVEQDGSIVIDLGVQIDGIFYPPRQPKPRGDDREDDPCGEEGSIIECENQVLGEMVDLVGTPYALHYQSDRVPGRTADRSLTITLLGPGVPESIKRVDLEVLIAGQRYTTSFAPAPSLKTTYVWDGKDAYGRLLQGAQPVHVRIGYAYDGHYVLADRFGSFPNGVPLASNPARTQPMQWQDHFFTLNPWGATPLGLGGWSLSAHHTYDPNGRVLYYGDGRVRSLEENDPVITTIAGTSATGYSGDGGPATAATFNYVTGIAVGPDGSIYVADANNLRIRRIGPDGIVTTVAGNGTGGSLGYSGDGGPATQAQIGRPWGIAIGPDGSLYFWNYSPFVGNPSNSHIRRVGPDGIITTIGGTGVAGYSGDGGPATQAQFGESARVDAVGPDGSIYIADARNGRVRRIGTDGIVTTVAGGGGNAGDGGPATSADLFSPSGVALTPDGSLYILEGTGRVRRVGADGIITTIAGFGSGDSGDGNTANLAGIFSATSIAAARDGSYYLSGGKLVRQVGTSVQVGFINTTAGGNGGAFAAFNGENGPARQAIVDADDVALVPDGSLLIASDFGNRIHRVAPPLPGFTGQELRVPSEDGVELFEFSAQGRHLRTRHSLTGAVLREFAYDSAGRLTQITDGDGNQTAIEHDASGRPTSIVGPYGQRTTLTTSAAGYLASVSNPAGNTIQLTSTPDGLLTSRRDPRDNLHQFTYDTSGRLTKDDDPAGGSTSLARTDTYNAFNYPDYQSTTTTALNRTSTYRVNELATLAMRRQMTNPNGLTTEDENRIDGSHITTEPTGMVTTMTSGPEARFGMLAPITKSATVKTPSNLTLTLNTASSAILANPADPLSLTSLTYTTAVNGRNGVSTYQAATRTFTATSPVGRQATSVIDLLGRLVQEQVAGLAPAAYTYDNRGRLASVTQGAGPDARSATFTYNPQGYLQSQTDPLGRVGSLVYDAAGRPTEATLPGNRVVGFSYDASGNRTGLTPPGRTAHSFTYNAVDLLTSYLAPSVGGSPTPTQYAYNVDRQLTRVTRPDGQQVNLAYDAGGRLASTTIARGAIVNTFDATSGNLTRVTAPGGVGLTYAYDGALALGTTWDGPVAGSVTHTYDSSFRVTEQRVNGANAITIAYDNDDLVTQAGALALTHHPQNGLLTGTTLGTVSDTWTYNAFAEPSAYTASAGGTAVFSQSFIYDKLGRITQKSETIAGATDVYTYTYDPAGRLSEVIKNGTSAATYTYDANGNRLTRTTPSGSQSGVYDAQDRLTQYGSTTYAYTTNGELLTRTTGGQATGYQYDELGNLLQVTPPTGPAVDYLTDGQNRRIGKRLGGVLQQGFLYDGQLRIVAELDGANQLVSRFVYGSRGNVPDYLIKGGVTYRIIGDHLGSPRLVVNSATGQIAQRLDYDEFGRILQDTAPGFQPFGFAGGLSDPTTGLVRFGARDYDPETGRWTAKDPILFYGGDTNLYAYASGDPINFLDPSGLAPKKCNKKTKEEELEELIAKTLKAHEALAKAQASPQQQKDGLEKMKTLMDTWAKKEARANPADRESIAWQRVAAERELWNKLYPPGEDTTAMALLRVLTGIPFGW